jgi:hypothetical protein
LHAVLKAAMNAVIALACALEPLAVMAFAPPQSTLAPLA